MNNSGTVIDHTTYDSFGNPTDSNPSAGDRYKFTGQEYDSVTGQYDYRARCYDAAIGRFTTQDPTGFGGGDPNLYRYCGNQPTDVTDPAGTDWWLWNSGGGKTLVHQPGIMVTKFVVADRPWSVAVTFQGGGECAFDVDPKKLAPTPAAGPIIRKVFEESAKHLCVEVLEHILEVEGISAAIVPFEIMAKEQDLWVESISVEIPVDCKFTTRTWSGNGWVYDSTGVENGLSVAAIARTFPPHGALGDVMVTNVEFGKELRDAIIDAQRMVTKNNMSVSFRRKIGAELAAIKDYDVYGP